MIAEPSGFPPVQSAGISSLVSGYSLGADPSGSQGRAYLSKFPFATDSNSTLVYSATWPSSPTVSRSRGTGHESSENGYATQGAQANNTGNFIDKFPFATDSAYTDIGNLSQSRSLATGVSSRTHGYVAGGYANPAAANLYNTIDKFTFASDSNTSDVGDITNTKRGPSGSQSTTSGYITGGENPPTVYNTIDKFPFATDTNATDIADLASAHTQGAGHQD
jgi:hypothetical protein